MTKRNQKHTYPIVFSLAILLLLGLVSPRGLAAQPLRKVENNAFQQGERMVYRAAYNSLITGNVTAGEATLEVLPGNRTIGDRKTMHIRSIAQTKGLFNLFFRVVNRYESYIDAESIAPWTFIRSVREKNYSKDQNVEFDQYRNIASSNTATVEVVPYVQDIISAFYYARTFNYDNVQPGDSFEVDFFLDDSVYVTRIVFDGRERIRTRAGTFNTLRFKPMVLEGSVFNQPYPMTLWISDDENKIPVLLESGLVVGNVRLELTAYEGLRNPLTSRIK